MPEVSFCLSLRYLDPPFFCESEGRQPGFNAWHPPDAVLTACVAPGAEPFFSVRPFLSEDQAAIDAGIAARIAVTMCSHAWSLIFFAELA